MHTSRSSAPRRGLIMALVAACAIFAALGTWQLARRSWKLALIERVQQRVHAPPQDAPPRERWADLQPAQEEYRHVRVHGHWLAVRPALVQAVTALGPGYWALVPLRQDDGGIVLINRGYVAAAADAPPPAPGADVTVTGLLRISEPRGAFLRANDPQADRWYSRDVAAIAAARGLAGVAPFFVDADAASGPPGAAAAAGPIGGQTVIAFANNHLVYALTWYGLALLTIVMGAGVRPRAGRGPAQDTAP